MSKPRSIDRRVESAFELVRKQRELVASTEVGSPAHRQASEVLALIEESHFLLSEMRRLAASPVAVAPLRPILSPQKPLSGRRRLPPLGAVAVFVAALFTAVAFWEMADPTPMNLRAGELSILAAQP